jgi:hypothetical protein
VKTLEIESSYEPLPAQAAFHSSKAALKFYGGAMGGGKSKALCEEAYQRALEFPGIEIVIARLEHTAIEISTRKTFFREVLPFDLANHCRIINSGGNDFCEFPNGSVIHFVGLSSATKFHSSEFGLLILDEAHQIAEDDVMTLNSRLRQKCKECLEAKDPNCTHLPHQILCGANPENPGHWLYRYFIQDADATEWGYYKKDLRLDEDSDPIGDAEFVFASALDNPYLPEAYVKNKLGSMKGFWRQRYLEGKWLFIDGACYFDQEAVATYLESCPEPLYRMDFSPTGIGSQAKRREWDLGKIRVYREPVEGRAYAIGADVATGRGLDYSSAYVVDLHDMALVAEFHGKIDQDLYAEQLHFLGRYYNTAWVAVEQAGGFGDAVIIALRDGKGGRPAYPRQYRHVLDAAVNMDHVSRYGFPMTSKTRPHVLGQLETAIRDNDVPWLTPILANQCLTFCEFENGSPSPRAQPGCNDDAVMSAAITLEMYRRYGRHEKREKRIEKRRTKRRKLALYPWQRSPQPTY